MSEKLYRRDMGYDYEYEFFLYFGFDTFSGVFFIKRAISKEISVNCLQD